MTDEMLPWLRNQIEDRDRWPTVPCDAVHGDDLGDACRKTHHDPEAVARADAELAILDHFQWLTGFKAHVVTLTNHGFPPPAELRDMYEARREVAVLSEVVCLLAYGYRHRPGYRPKWAPEGATP